MADEPRDWGTGGEPPAPRPPRPPAPGSAHRASLPPRRDEGRSPYDRALHGPDRGDQGERGDLPPATQAYRSSLPPRRAAQPVLPPARGRRAARLLSWIAVVTSVAVLGISGAGYALVNHYDGNIDRIDGIFGEGPRPAAAPRNAQNFLIVGSDSRGDLEAGEGVQGTGENFVTGQRADTVILAHLYGGRSNQAQLVSFPRDAYVEIPSHVDPETGEVVPATMGKLNRSFQIGGAPLLIDTVENLSGIRVDHYMQIDFDGFKGMVDQLGGIEVCLPKPAKEKDSGIDLPAGRSVVGGDQALAFVRQRKGLPNGDIDRIGRQQQFMGAVIRKVLSAGTLLNPLRLNGFLDVATSSLQVDEDLEVGDLRDLALRFRSFSAGGVSFATVPVESINGSRKNADGLFESVVLLDEERMEDLFQRLRDDIPPGEPAPDPTGSPAPRLIVRPENVRVEVLNGAGVNGLGRRAATDLREVGFAIIGAPGNRGEGATQTTVLHGPDKADSAATLAAAVPGAVTQLDPSLGRTLQIVVGSDYRGAKQVQVAGAPTKRPTAPSATATPEVKTAAEDPCAAA